MACDRLFLRLDIHRILLRSCRRYSGVLASSISVQQVCIFSQCWNGLLVGCHDACWWILSGWFSRYRVGLDDAACRWYPPSRPWPVVLLLVSTLVCLCPAILRVSISCRQCWPYKVFWRLALFIGYFKTSGAEVGHRFHRWKLSADVMEKRMESWALLSWHWSVNSINNKRFSYSQLGAHLFHPGFSAETSTKHLQLHLLYFSNSQFENSIGRAFGSSRPTWSLGFLYP